MRGDVNGVSNV